MSSSLTGQRPSPAPPTPLERLFRYERLTLQSTLAELSVRFVSLDVDQTAVQLEDIVFRHPYIPGVVLLRQGQYAAMISRRKYLEQMSHRFGRDLYLRRPLSQLLPILASDGLVLSSADQIELAASVVLLRPQEEIYDPVVVRFPDGRHGVLDVQEILLAQTRIVEITNAENQRLVNQLGADLAARKKAELAQVSYNRRLIQQTGALEQISRLDSVRASDMEGAAQEIMRLVGDALHLDRTALWLFDRQDGKEVLREVACHDKQPGHRPPAPVPVADLDDYMAALRRERTLMAASPATDPRLAPLRTTVLANSGIVSLLHVIQLVEQRPVGILRCELREQRQWSSDELNFIDAVLNFLALLEIGQQRNRAVRARLDSEARMERMIENSPVGICLLDAEGVILKTNPSLRRFFNLSDDDLIGRDFGWLYAEPGLHPMMLDRFRREGRLPGQEVAFRSGLGRRLWTVMSWEPLAQDGGGELIVVWLFDLSKQKQAEENLRHAKEQAEAATRAKSSFLATMSHEIRTPMNGVLGLLDLVKRTPLSSDQARTLWLIEESAQSLLRIIDDILDFSKIEAGKLELDPHPFSVAEMAEGVAATLGPAARRKGLRLLCDIDPGLTAGLVGDPVRIRQVLVNLMGNAIKFTTRGHVTLRVQHQGSEGPGDRLRFEVQDTGIGLTDVQIARLFQPFAQAEISTSRRFGGTGLGLSICRMLISLMNGRIGVTSQPDQGSTFWVELVLPRAPEGAVNVMATLVPLDGVRVLLDMAHADEADILRAYLAADGASLLSPDSRTLPDVTVTDRVADGGAEGDIVRLRNEDRPLRRTMVNRLVAAAAGLADLGELDWVASLDRLPAPPQEPVLIVDDHPINREVIIRQLEQLGCRVEEASNGQEALNAFARGRYALVLTDCEMPVMDGLTLARAIRRMEDKAGRDRIPIIALTANALGDQAARCLEAGMDDCLIKPIDTKRLGRSLLRWFPPADGARPPAPPPPPAPAAAPPPPAPARAVPALPANPAEQAPPISLTGLIDLVGNDKAALRALLGRFLSSSRPCFAALSAAVAEGTAADAVRAEAHRLKGAAAMVGATGLAEVCHRLESAGRSGDSGEFPGLMAEIEQRWAEVTGFIDAF